MFLVVVEVVLVGYNRQDVALARVRARAPECNWVVAVVEAAEPPELVLVWEWALGMVVGVIGILQQWILLCQRFL